MNKTIIAQRLLLEYCSNNGYSNIFFTGSDRVSAIDQNGCRCQLGINLYGDILDLDAREIIAAADTSHDITNTYELPARWKHKEVRD